MTHRPPQMLMRTLPSRITPLLESFRTLHTPVPNRLLARLTPGKLKEDKLPPLRPSLVVPTRDKTPEETACGLYYDQGQFMARQENWHELSQLIRKFDTARSCTPGGLPAAELLAGGARSDVVTAAVEAIDRGDAKAAGLPIKALEDVLEEHCEDHGVAFVVAMAHIDLGWAWRGESWNTDIPVEHRAAFHAHFAAAARIVDRFDPLELEAPTLAAVRCALLAAECNPGSRVADDYEDLIDLAPVTPRHMRAMGNHLLPRWFGNYRTLDLEARRTATRTWDIWGSGGYAWVYFDALSVDPGALSALDVEYFVEGIHDILARRPDQHTVNLLAALTGMTLSGVSEPGLTENWLTTCFDWIAREHLREIHPLVWMSVPAMAGQSDPARDSGDPQRKGRVRAMSTLSRHFAPQIRQGYRVIYGQNGPEFIPVQ